MVGGFWAASKPPVAVEGTAAPQTYVQIARYSGQHSLQTGWAMTGDIPLKECPDQFMIEDCWICGGRALRPLAASVRMHSTTVTLSSPSLVRLEIAFTGRPIPRRPPHFTGGAPREIGANIRPDRRP